MVFNFEHLTLVSIVNPHNLYVGTYKLHGNGLYTGAVAEDELDTCDVISSFAHVDLTDAVLSQSLVCQLV